MMSKTLHYLSPSSMYLLSLRDNAKSSRGLSLTTKRPDPVSQPAQVSERTPLRYQFSVISSRATLVAASHHTIIARIHCVTELDLSSQPQQQHHEHPLPPRRLNRLHHRVRSSHPRRWYEQVHFVQSGLPSFELVWDS
jgi:hypothetical protein